MTCTIHNETETCLQCLIDKLFDTCNVLYFPKGAGEAISHTPGSAKKQDIIAAVMEEMK